MFSRGGEEMKEEKYKVDGVFIIDNPIRYEHHCQVICDLLSTPDGKVATHFNHHLHSHIPIYWAYNDQLYKYARGY